MHEEKTKRGSSIHFKDEGDRMNVSQLHRALTRLLIDGKGNYTVDTESFCFGASCVEIDDTGDKISIS